MPKKEPKSEYDWEDPEIEAAIDALSAKPKRGVDAVFEKALEAHLADLADAQPEGAKIPFQSPVTVFAHSYAGIYAMSVRNEVTGRSFTGGLTLTPDKSGEFFDVSGNLLLPGQDGGRTLAGRGTLDDQELLLALDVSEASVVGRLDLMPALVRICRSKKTGCLQEPSNVSKRRMIRG